MKVNYYQIVTNLISGLGLPNWQQLVKEIDYRNGQLYYDLKTGKTKSISADFVNKVIARFPQVSSSWLMTGNGEMFSSLPAPLTVSGDTGNYQHVVGNDNNVVGNNSTLYNMCDEKRTKHVIGCKEGKIIEIDIDSIRGMSLEEFCIGNELKPFERDNEIPDCDCTYTMCSNELWPYLMKGDKICIKKIPINEVTSGKSYLVDTVNDGKMIKRVDVVEGGEYMLSLPIDVPDYPVITRPVSEIYAFYDLVCRISINPTVQFSQPLFVSELMKQVSGLVKYAQTSMENHSLALRNAEKALTNQEATLKVLNDAMRIIEKMQGKENQ